MRLCVDDYDEELVIVPDNQNEWELLISFGGAKVEVLFPTEDGCTCYLKVTPLHNGSVCKALKEKRGIGV